MLYDIVKIIILACICLLPGSVFAYHSAQPVGFGGMALEILGPVTLLSDFVSTAALVIGAMMLMGSFIRYTRYRRNPLEAPLSSVIVLFIIGACLVALAVVHMVYENDFAFLRHY